MAMPLLIEALEMKRRGQFEWTGQMSGLMVKQGLHLVGGQFSDSDRQSVFLSLRHHGDHCVLVARGQLATWRGQAWCHDVGSAQYELNGALVHLLRWQQEWI